MQTLNYELQIQSSNSVTSIIYGAIDGQDPFDVLYAFDTPTNPAYECSISGSIVDAQTIPAGKTITHVYSVDPLHTEILPENTDVVGRMFGDSNYCGPKTHVFTD